MKELILDIEYDNYTIPYPKAKNILFFVFFYNEK